MRMVFSRMHSFRIAQNHFCKTSVPQDATLYMTTRDGVQRLPDFWRQIRTRLAKLTVVEQWLIYLTRWKTKTAVMMWKLLLIYIIWPILLITMRSYLMQMVWSRKSGKTSSHEGATLWFLDTIRIKTKPVESGWGWMTSRWQSQEAMVALVKAMTGIILERFSNHMSKNITMNWPLIRSSGQQALFLV